MAFSKDPLINSFYAEVKEVANKKIMSMTRRDHFSPFISVMKNLLLRVEHYINELEYDKAMMAKELKQLKGEEELNRDSYEKKVLQLDSSVKALSCLDPATHKGKI